MHVNLKYTLALMHACKLKIYICPYACMHAYIIYLPYSLFQYHLSQYIAWLSLWFRWHRCCFRKWRAKLLLFTLILWIGRRLSPLARLTVCHHANPERVVKLSMSLRRFMWMNTCNFYLWTEAHTVDSRTGGWYLLSPDLDWTDLTTEQMHSGESLLEHFF